MLGAGAAGAVQLRGPLVELAGPLLELRRPRLQLLDLRGRGRLERPDARLELLLRVHVQRPGPGLELLLGDRFELFRP